MFLISNHASFTVIFLPKDRFIPLFSWIAMSTLDIRTENNNKDLRNHWPLKQLLLSFSVSLGPCDGPATCPG